MTISDVKTQIRNNDIQPYYIFAGDEIEVQRIYINKIAEVLGYSVTRAERILDVWQDIVSPTLFNDACVYVVRDDKDILQDETLQMQLDKGELNGNIVILLLTSVDKRTKWYKANSDKIVLFEHLSDDLLIKYCQREIALNRRNCERLIAICENDFSRMLLEIDKIKSFITFLPDCDCNKVFEQFVADGVIHTPPKDAIFDLVDAILKRQKDKIYDLLSQCYAVGEANMVILSVLYNNAKQVLQVQACESKNPKEISDITGLTSWQVKCAKERCGHYRVTELFNILKLVQEIQKGIITGQIEDEMSVEYLLVNIL